MDSTEVAQPAAEPRTLAGLTTLLLLQKPLVAGATLAACAAALLALVPFFVVARMATAIYAEPPDLSAVQTLAWTAGGALLMRYLCVGLANMLAHVAAFRILHALRVQLARKLGAVPLSFFSRRGAGELKKTMMDDVNQIETFVAHHFPDAIAAAVAPLFTAVALFSVDWRMTLASLVMAPLAVLSMAIAMRNVGQAHQQWNDIQNRMNTGILEYFRGIHVAKTFGLSAQRFGELARAIEEGLAWMEGFMRTNGRGYSYFGALIGSSLVVLVPLGGYFYTHDTLSLESLVLFLVLGPQLLMSMMRLMFAWGNLDRIQGANGRLQDIFAAPQLDARVGSAGARPSHAGVSFQQVGFRYEQAGPEVLQDVSFEAPAGKVTALVGPSGAGKTTLVRLVPRLWEASSGSVLLGGVDVQSLPLDQLLAQISMVFQEVFLFHGSVRDNLRLARPDATDAEIDAACRAARAYDFIQALPDKYDTLLGERGARLSGGERQRLSIARALLKGAPVLLLDEATAFADPENEARIQEALSELCVDRTVLVIAHRLSTIASADHIVVLDAGRVVDQGTHAQLLERCALYQRLWRSHTEALDWSLHVAPTASNVAQEVA
jgi:ATP-binding cassette, subfamily B, bacterial IrtA/YbtP